MQTGASAPNAAPTTTSKTWTNPRKRPHHDPTSLFEPISNDDALREVNDGKELHASKRSRAAEWPLKNTDDTADTQKHDERNDKRSSATSIRPGKFLEGSMNDKVSQRPPSLYTRDEQAMEEYANMHGKGLGQMDMDIDVTFDAGIESHKPSGMFRFGKAIANAFKPLTAWQGMFKEKEKETSTSPEKNILQERQAKAAEAYADLKKSGYKGTQAYRGVQDLPAIDVQDTKKQNALFRDSGIDMGGEPCSEWTPNDQLIGLTDALLVPPPPSKARVASALSNTSSARKSSHHLRKPSLQGLKKVASQIHLSPVKKPSETPPLPFLKIDHASEDTVLRPPVGSGLRSEPSKRDIAKQFKLGKKVSDLEYKLETARRELELSVSNAPPVPDLPAHVGRKTFKPGALPSLPSERNMTPLKDHPAPADSTMRGELLGEILQSLPPKRSSAQSTQQSNVFTPMTKTDGARALESGKGSPDIARPRTSRGIKAQTPTGVHKRLPRVPSKTPHNSPLTYAENVPPIPKTTTSVPPGNETQPTPAASKTTDHTSVVHADQSPPPFLGRPTATSPVRNRSKKSKQGISPPPPSLASAKKANTTSNGSATPMEGLESSTAVDPRNSKLPPKTKRGISPPPPSLASAKKPMILSDETATQVGGAGSSESPNDQVGPLRSMSPLKLNGDPVKKINTMKGKSSRGSGKEDFEWDDDVF